MNTKSASVKLSFEKTKTDLVSVKLRVTYQRQQRRFAFPIKNGVFISERDFDRLLKYHEKGSERTGEEIRQIYVRIKPFIATAENLVETVVPFSFSAFRDAFYKKEIDLKPIDPNDVIKRLYEKSETIKKGNRIGSAASYKNAGTSLARFVRSLDDSERNGLLGITVLSKRRQDKQEVVLRFEQVTKDFLEAYQHWMLNFGKAPKKTKLKKGESPVSAKPATLTTVGIYCRQLRSVFNDAIADDIISQNFYPFGRRGFTIPAGNNLKKALPLSDVQKIANFQCTPDSFQQRGKDLWLFSYLSNGMNITDVCNIKWRDIDQQGNSLHFVRKKTARSRKGNQTKIRVKLREESWEIINRYAIDRKPDSFVFPFLNEGMSEQRKKSTISQIIKMTNQHVRAIAEKLGIETDVTTYSARHSFATILLQNEAPVAFISEALGHQNTSTTQSYLGQFEGDQADKYLSKLL